MIDLLFEVGDSRMLREAEYLQNAILMMICLKGCLLKQPLIMKSNRVKITCSKLHSTKEKTLSLLPQKSAAKMENGPSGSSRDATKIKSNFSISFVRE